MDETVCIVKEGTMYEMKKEQQDKGLVIKNASFITSAATASQFITPTKPMIAVCGKSNVGKSSFINMLANKKKLAKTSSEPGRTRLVNYFDFGEFILIHVLHPIHYAIRPS